MASRMVKISNSLLRKLGLMMGESKGFDDPKEILPPVIINRSIYYYIINVRIISRESGDIRLVDIVKKLPLVGKGEKMEVN